MVNKWQCSIVDDKIAESLCLVAIAIQHRFATRSASLQGHALTAVSRTDCSNALSAERELVLHPGDIET
jgi:hypothetical protein